VEAHEACQRPADGYLKSVASQDELAETWFDYLDGIKLSYNSMMALF
jgi:hypothetical protein